MCVCGGGGGGLDGKRENEKGSHLKNIICKRLPHFLPSHTFRRAIPSLLDVLHVYNL